MMVRVGSVALVALILVLLLCVSARAGRYTIHDCPGSLQPNFEAGAWVAYGAVAQGAGGFQGSCTPGSTLGAAIGWYADEQPLNTNLGVELQSPSQAITIRELRLVWAVAHQSGGSDTFAQVVADTGVQFIGNTPFSAGAGNPMVERLPEGTRTVYVYSYCSYDQSTNCYFPSSVSPVIKLEGMDTTLEDDAPPSTTVTGGALAGSGPLSGASTLQFTATDQSGVREAQLLLDGAPVIAHSYASQCSYTSFAACPQSQTDSMTLDTTKIANGEHLLALSVIDAAGNTQTVDQHAILVSNATAGSGPAPGESGASAPACAAAPGTQASFVVAGRHDRLHAGYGRRTRLRGRLLGPGRAPLTGATVEVFTQPAVGVHQFSALGQVVTGASGQFKVTLPAGISRTVCLRYRPLPGGHATAALVLAEHVSAGVKLQIHPHHVGSNGTIILTGRVLGGYISPEGKVVELQVFYLGRWRVFQTVRSQPDGQFTSFYSFIAGHGAFKFRARVRNENEYPYSLGRSRPVIVRAG